ncbi:hypothetical protein THRCLA_23247 [Thraustotheca clavata]|uniref:C3H1-type domain-containing protein n=1 Tax=Thraustotheca clavata TaxID=74557 RepID=A0A1V9Y8M6_9STRA|nr:hypothetical protein THRCLA_23247 [Thraustotheca clavata]
MDKSKPKYAVFNPAAAPPCRFFASVNGCMKGDSCQFRHEGVGKVKQAPKKPTSKRGPCHFYQQGQCRNGAQCSFTHDDGLNDAMNKLSIASAPEESDTILTRDLLGPFFAIDVECVATGKNYLDRDVARIAVVSENEATVFDAYVKPSKPIVSYLTQLTGITARHLENARSLQEVLIDLKAILPKDCVLVGQSVDKDVEWLGLKEQEDFREIFDVAKLFCMPLPSKTSATKIRYFSLRHVVKYLLDESIQESDHDPVVDAVYAMKVFKRFRYLHESPGHRQAVLQTLAKTPQTPSFAKRHPVIDGVSLVPPQFPFE